MQEKVIMAENEVSETILGLLDSGRISWPKSVIERNEFITENFGKVWDALLDINIHANLEIFSHMDDDTSICGASENASGTAWDALSRVLLLILIFEDALGIDITFPSKYGQPNNFSAEKAKVRSRIWS
jgi:hypothetical protein